MCGRSFCSHLGVGKLSPTPILLPTFPSCEISGLANRAAPGPSVKPSAVLLFQFAYYQIPAQGAFLSPPVLSLKFPTDSHEYHTQQFPPHQYIRTLACLIGQRLAPHLVRTVCGFPHMDPNPHMNLLAKLSSSFFQGHRGPHGF